VEPRAGNPDTWAEKDGRSPTTAFAASTSRPISVVPRRSIRAVPQSRRACPELVERGRLNTSGTSALHAASKPDHVPAAVSYLVWEIQSEHATPVGTSHSNRPKTLMHQIQRDPEPEPGAPDALGGKKGLKDSLQRLLVHARSRIGNGDANSFAAILQAGRLPAS
jgi:hypothetical protein